MLTVNVSMLKFYFPFIVHLQQDKFLYSIKPMKVFRTKLKPFPIRPVQSV